MLHLAGEALELLDCVEDLWPNLSGWADSTRAAIRIGAIARLRPETMLDEPDGYEVPLSLASEVVDFEAGNDGTSRLDRFLGQLYAYGELRFRIAASTRLSDFQVSSDLLRGSETELEAAYARLGEDDAMAAGIHTRAFLYSHWLFPWRAARRPLLLERYRAALRISAYSENLSMKIVDLNLPSDIQWPDGLQDEVRNILYRVLSGVSDFGFDGYCDRVLSDGGQWGPGSMVGSGRRIPLIPGQGNASCDVLAVALARGTTATSAQGLPKVLHAVNEHMINCSSIVKVVLLLTDSWSPRVVSPHEGAFKAHRQQGRVLLPLLVSRQTLGEIGWP
jgi:hypothetical protein